MTPTAGRLAGRFIRARAIARGDQIAFEEFVDRSGWTDGHIIKAAISGSNTTNASAFVQQVGADFMEYVRAKSVVGRLSGFRRTPFATRVVRQTSGPAAFWVGESGLIPVGRATYTKDDGLAPTKCSAIAVQTLELARASGSESILLADLGKATAEAIDASFFDPANSGSTDEPASVTNGQTSVSASTTAAADLADAVSALVAGGGDFEAAVWVMRPEVYSILVLTRVASEDGRIATRPVLTTSAIPKDTSGSPIVLVDPSGIELAGGVDAQLDVSLHGDIIMDDDPTGTGAAGYTGLWQTESFAMRATAHIAWRAASGRAVYVADAAY
ncbi:MAG: hypothetical protein KF822_12690 [Steroidobacteraceae bacterium]|nr:hypothetical protein [Steroidobacteraceae bacterium]